MLESDALFLSLVPIWLPSAGPGGDTGHGVLTLPSLLPDLGAPAGDVALGAVPD